MAKKLKVVRLSDFAENPDNPSTVTDEAFNRLVGKLRRVPEGLTAQRIAYVSDIPDFKFVVISGNKRLRVLKQIYGEDAEVPAEWFQDVTSMSDDERREFIVSANVTEGTWIADELLKLMPADELRGLMDADEILKLLDEIPKEQKIAGNKEFDNDSFGDDMVLKFKITAAERDRALKVLDAIPGGGREDAFMKIVRGEV